MLAVRLLNRMRQYRVSLAELLSRLPDFGTASKTVPCDGNPGRILRRLAEEGAPAGTEGAGEGARISLPGGEVLIRPAKTGRKLVLIAEAANAEIAEELCGRLEERVRAVALDIGKEKQ